MSEIDIPWPPREQLHHWAKELEGRMRTDPEVGGPDLVAVLADARRTNRDLARIADWLLKLAREHGASLPDLASAWSQSGRRELVHGPDARLARLGDRHGDADCVLQAFLRLPLPPAERSDR